MAEDANNTEENQKGEVNFSQEQQAKVDELISKRLSDASKKHADEIEALKAKFSNELEESKKTAKMKEEEKAKYENEKALKELESLRAEKLEREHQDKINELVSESGLNPKISSKLFYHIEADKAKNEIANFKKVFDEAVLDEVNKRIKGHTPNGNENGKETQDAAMRRAMGLPVK